MNHLISIVNKLQDVFGTVSGNKMDLPQIVAIGSQSCGKSSIIENLVGKDFLPRGSGIVTRRPLILQLINIPKASSLPESNDNDDDNESSSFSEEWGEFLHLPGSIFKDFSEIKNEIIRETDRLAGKNKGLSGEPITLKIYSPNVLNITLIDLPGLTQVPVGDQPKNIGDQIRNLVLSYITKPSTIILAISPANSDIVNSDALKLAKLVDHDGSRTIGVITKLDLMDKGTDAVDILKGNVVHLKHGFYAIVNRSVQDIIIEKTIKQSLKSEKEFFENHPDYSQILHKCGTSSLINVLNKTLMNHIRSKLPELKVKIAQQLAEAQLELASIGKTPIEKSKGALLLDIITQYSEGFKKYLDGNLSDKTITNQLVGGSRIYYTFHNIFGNFLSNMNALDGLSDEDISITIRNSTGARAPLFVTEIAFEILVKRQNKKFKEPSIQCLDFVQEEIQSILLQLENNTLNRYENLKERINNVAIDLLKRYYEPCKSVINNFLEIENSYINTNHADFIGSEALNIALNEKNENKKAPTYLDKSPSSNRIISPLKSQKNMEFEVNLIKILLESYFNIVRKNIQDIVPKTIMYLVVNKLKDNLHNELVSQLFKEDQLDILLKETDESISRRNACEQIVEVLSKANNILNEVRDEDIL